MQKALGTDRIINVARALQLRKERSDEIDQIHHLSHSRKAIAVIDTWLREDFNVTIPPESTPHPTWWNLVWAVAHNVGGNNPAKAKNIARDYGSKNIHQLQYGSWKFTFFTVPFRLRSVKLTEKT